MSQPGVPMIPEPQGCQASDSVVWRFPLAHPLVWPDGSARVSVCRRRRAPSTSPGRRLRGPGMRHEPSESADGDSPVPGRVRTWHRVSASTPRGDRVAGSFARPCTQALAPGGNPRTAPRRVCQDGPRGQLFTSAEGANIGAAMRSGGSAAVDAATPAITPTHSPELPYAGRSRRPRPRVARRPAVTQTGSPRRPGVGEYSEGVTGVNILPLLSTPQASVGAQFACRRRYGRRGRDSRTDL